jgi:hypothetical protein
MAGFTPLASVTIGDDYATTTSSSNAIKFVNRARMTTTTQGTGTIVLSSAQSGYQSFSNAGVADGDVIRYIIENGNRWEIGTGTYTEAGRTLTRVPTESSDIGSAIELLGNTSVFVSGVVEDLLRGSNIGTIIDQTLDLSSGNVFSYTPTIDTTFIFSSLPADTDVYKFTLNITGLLTTTFTYPTSVKWEGGLAPDAPADTEIDILTFYTDDNGFTWYGIKTGDAMDTAT